MAVTDRDKYTGHLTTGHEWNGIKELNTGIPMVVKLCLLGTFLFSIGYWYVMPSWPAINTFYPGTMGIDQQETLENKMVEALEEKRPLMDAIVEGDFKDILYDDRLMAHVKSTGERLFQDNCSMCHGREGVGNRFFPSLADDHWLWGDDPEHIYETLRVGINSEHPESRQAVMPALGDTGALDSKSISDVVYYVRSSAKLPIAERSTDKKRFNQGKATFDSVCAGCHGVNLQGNQMLGAPNLVDRYWLYGHEEQALIETIQHGRAGYMPSWEYRLEPYQRKILALYVTTLD